MHKKVSMAQFISFEHNYENSPHWKGYSFGKAFCIKYEIQNNELSYEEDYQKARATIIGTYVENN